MTLLDEIQKTIEYADSFGGKLTTDQLFMRLLSNKLYSKSEIIKQVTSYKLRVTCLAGRQASENRENNIKIKLAKELVKNHLSKFDNIQFVAITGSVAAENTKGKEDIDLFIICRAKTMWITRLLLRIYIKLANIPHRKYGQSEKPNDFCFNLWMDEDDLKVRGKLQNQKNAVDVIMMKVIYNKDNVYQKFIGENSWVKKYVANGYNQISDVRYQMSDKIIENSIIVKLINYLAFVGQLLYIRLKGSIKNISLTQAFFHK